MACGPRGDSALYSHALTSAGTYEQARASCDRIQRVDSRGDCQVAIVERFERYELAECERILGMEPRTALWRDECVFLVAEGLRKRGELDLALEACVQTRFARQCAWHLVEDEANASLTEEPAVAERRIERFSKARPIPDAAMQFWRIRFRTAAGQGHPPDELVCAALQAPTPCLEAFERGIIELLEARRAREPQQVCPPAGALGDTMGRETMDLAWARGPRADLLLESWRRDRCTPL